MDPWQYWSSVHSHPPLAHILRGAITERWMRVHHLPGGRRLPANDSDRSEVVHRNNMAAAAVLGIGSSCMAWITCFGAKAPRGAWTHAPPPPAWDLEEDAAEELAGARFYVSAFPWQPGCFDETILLAADGLLGPLAVLSLGTQGTYCPYDGGADLFLPGPEYVSSTKALFAAWLSDLPSGL